MIILMIILDCAHGINTKHADRFFTKVRIGGDRFCIPGLESLWSAVLKYSLEHQFCGRKNLIGPCTMRMLLGLVLTELQYKNLVSSQDRLYNQRIKGRIFDLVIAVPVII